MNTLHKLFILLSAVALVLTACAQALPAPNPAVELTETVQPVNTALQATFTFTVSPAPSLTLRPTRTLYPTITPLPTKTPVYTETLTPTEPMVSDPTEAAIILTDMASTPFFTGDPAGSPYACALIDKKPKDYIILKPKQELTVWWELQNVGQKSWANGIVQFALWLGQRMANNRHFDLPNDVKPGAITRIRLNIQTPGETGTYVSIWGLQNLRSRRTFCFVALKIIVAK